MMAELITNASESAETVRRFEELRESGMLWLINTTVFHPHGLAIALIYGADDTEPLGWDLVAAPAGEPFQYADDPHIHARYRAARDTMAAARITGETSRHSRQEEAPIEYGDPYSPADLGKID